MEEEGRNEKVASSKVKPIGILECENRYHIYYQNRAKMAKIDTLFMTKMAEKPYPLGLQIPIYPIYIVREYPPSGWSTKSFGIHFFSYNSTPVLQSTAQGGRFQQR